MVCGTAELGSQGRSARPVGWRIQKGRRQHSSSNHGPPETPDPAAPRAGHSAQLPAVLTASQKAGASSPSRSLLSWAPITCAPRPPRPKPGAARALAIPSWGKSGGRAEVSALPASLGGVGAASPRGGGGTAGLVPSSPLGGGSSGGTCNSACSGFVQRPPARARGLSSLADCPHPPTSQLLGHPDLPLHSLTVRPPALTIIPPH